MPLNGQFLDKSGLTYLWSKLKTKLAAKQDSIADLSTIRSGAAAGATAVQPADMSAALTLKQDKLTFDSAPTESSTNPVTSGGVWTDQQRQETEIGAVANAGAKNLLDYTFSINGDTNNRIANGVTFTINADRSISTSGTASALIVSSWIQMNYVVPSDPVILSGCPAGGSNNTYRIDILDGSQTGSVVAADYGNGVLIKSSMFTTGIGLIRIRIANGQNVDGLVFKPMLRRAEITDDTFVPYAPTNRELYETKANTSELHAILPNITSSTTIQDYVDSLSKGVYTAFIANVSNPSDSPINANCFVNIYVYSASTAAVELIPLAAAEMSRTYTMRKISGTWRKWYMVEGTVVS